MRVRGTCHFFLAVDLGFQIDLVRAEQILAADQVRQTFKRPRRAPEAAQLSRRSLRVNQSGTPVALGAWRSEGAVEVALWEFGAATIDYTIPIDGNLADLRDLSDLLWDNPDLFEDGRRRAEQLLATIRPAVEKPSLGTRLEDYVVYELRLADSNEVSRLWTEHAAITAGILRAEPGPLSDQETHDALAMRCSYLPDEVAIVDWFAALLVGDDMEDERLVLELTIVELLSLRNLDDALDQGVETAYDLLTKESKAGFLAGLRAPGDLRLISQLQADAAVLFEGVDNALKLLGDQYLARLYRLVSERFHLPAWDSAIERKLKVIDGIYEKLSSRTSNRRLELLEVIIIILFVVSIFQTFLPQLLGSPSAKPG